MSSVYVNKLQIIIKAKKKKIVKGIKGANQI